MANFGRSLRRKKERQDRLDGKRDKLQMSRREFNQMKEELSREASGYSVEALMTCFALAEHRLYGFGLKRLSKSLQYINELMDGILNDTATVEDYKKELETETGIVIKSE